MIIGKALFERISLNCYLTKSIWRQICGKKVREGDFSFYDRDVYKYLVFIKDNSIDTDLGVNFTYLVPSDTKDGHNAILKPDGDKVMVSNQNKKEYIQLVINYFCVKSCSHYIDAIKQGI